MAPTAPCSKQLTNKTVSLLTVIDIFVQVKSLQSKGWRRNTQSGTSASTRKRFSPWWNSAIQTSFSYTRWYLIAALFTLCSNFSIWMSTSWWRKGKSCSQSSSLETSCFNHCRGYPTCTNRTTFIGTSSLRTCFATTIQSKLRTLGK